MYTHKPAAVYSLDGQIELFIHSRSNQILRTVSFDNGDHWMEWVKMNNHETTRSVGFASTPDSRHKYFAYRATELLPNNNREYVFKSSDRFGFDWNNDTPRVNQEKFASGPSIVCTSDGKTVHLFGQRGLFGFVLEQSIGWWESKERNGRMWPFLEKPLPVFVPKSEPAAVMSADGKFILVFAIGDGDRCWYVRTTNAGQSWSLPAWQSIRQAEFTSGPSACISASGQHVIVAARSSGDFMMCNRSSDGGASWKGWQVIAAPTSVFSSGPALCASWNLDKVFVFAVGRDFKIWMAKAEGADAPFGNWSVADRHNRLKAI